MTEQDFTTRYVEMIFPEHANHYGTLFGGNALHLLSKAAFIAASRHAQQAVVMAACADVQFYQPVRVGQMLALTAQVVRTGRSAMTVEVSGQAENLLTGHSGRAMHGRFEMVAVDAQGRPCPMNTQSPVATAEFLTETS